MVPLLAKIELIAIVEAQGMIENSIALVEWLLKSPFPFHFPLLAFETMMEASRRLASHSRS